MSTKRKPHKHKSVKVVVRQKEKRALNVLVKQMFGMPLHLHKHWKMVVASIGQVEGVDHMLEANSEENTLDTAYLCLSCTDTICSEDRIPYVVLCEDTDTKEQSIILRLPRSVTDFERFNMAKQAHDYIRDKFGIQVNRMEVA